MAQVGALTGAIPLALLVRRVDELCAAGCNIVVVSIAPTGTDESRHPLVQSVTLVGQVLSDLGQVAKARRAYLCLSFDEISGYSTTRVLPKSCVILGPSGAVCAHRILSTNTEFGGERLKKDFIDTEYGRIAIAAHCDLLEVDATYDHLGVWLVLAPVQYSRSDPEESNLYEEHLRNSLSSQGFFVVEANSGGSTTVYNPGGTILTSLNDKNFITTIPAATVHKSHYLSGFRLPKITNSQEPHSVKVAAIQVSSDLANTPKNIEKIVPLCEEAAANGAKFIVLPECALTGYLSQDLKINWHLPGRSLHSKFTGLNPEPHALRVSSPEVKSFGPLAKRIGRNYYNTICLVSPHTGGVVATYRKMNPWPHPEVSWATAGLAPVCYQTEYGKVGLAVCFDIHSVLPLYKTEGIWTLLYSIAWVDGEPLARWFHNLLPERLRTYDFNVVGANWAVDHYQPWFGYGSSTIFRSHGEVVSTASNSYGSEIVYATLPSQPQGRTTNNSRPSPKFSTATRNKQKKM
ncbi:carbon-nitrogen hydrolase family protein [Pelomyxa schiedti]|nr:carbon-nitrogen hydrolase family protein [Pelomyxa schiedti]